MATVEAGGGRARRGELRGAEVRRETSRRRSVECDRGTRGAPRDPRAAVGALSREKILRGTKTCQWGTSLKKIVGSPAAIRPFSQMLDAPISESTETSLAAFSRRTSDEVMRGFAGMP